MVVRSTSNFVFTLRSFSLREPGNLKGCRFFHLQSTRGAIKLLDGLTAEEIASFKSPDTEPVQVVFTRDGQDLLALGPNAVQVWHAPPLEQIQLDWLGAGAPPPAMGGKALAESRPGGLPSAPPGRP